MQQQSTPDRIIVLPPAPLCDRCGHSLCPCCGDWCDTLTAAHEPCCHGRCDVDRIEVLAWQNQCQPLINRALARFERPSEEITVLAAYGPWLPVLRRRAWLSAPAPASTPG